MMTKAKVTNVHWDEKDTAVQEATLEVEFPNGDTQLFTIPVVRMTSKLPAKRNSTKNKEWTDDKK